MDDFFEILKYTIPAIIVFVSTFFVLKKFMDNEYRKQLLEMRKNNQKVINPLRLQAYERLVLLLERISLNNLVVRTYQKGMSAKLLQVELIKVIRHEFEHNLTQQIYVSSTVWEHVRSAKEETVKVINIASTQMKENSTGNDLSQKIFEIILKLEKSSTKICIDALKKEVRQFY